MRGISKEGLMKKKLLVFWIWKFKVKITKVDEEDKKEELKKITNFKRRSKIGKT